MNTIFVSSKWTCCRKSMKAQSCLKFPSELCFGIMNTTKDSYLLNSKVAFLKRGQNAAGICPFFLRCLGTQFEKNLFKTFRIYIWVFLFKLLYLRHLISMRKLNVIENIYIRFRSPMLKEDNRPPRPRLRPLLNLFGNHYFSTYIFIE